MVAFEQFPKIDAHFHSNYFNAEYLRIAKAYNVRYITINTNTAIFPSLPEQETVAQAYLEAYPDRFAYVASFDMQHWQSADWYDLTIAQLQSSIAHGAVGVKIWKNIGMELRKSDGTFLMIDDPFFYLLFDFLTQREIPVLAHLGEPRNCWLPLEAMTTDRNRIYFEKHPEFHAYLHPEIPSYESQIAARDHILERYPALRFVGAHLGSLEWSIDELAKRLDRYPNFFVDISSRLGHLQLQSVTNYDGVRNFFLRFANRIMYGTDAYDNVQKLESALVNDWHFLATEQNCISPEVTGTFRGIALPEEVLYRIYYMNAKQIYSNLSL